MIEPSSSDPMVSVVSITYNHESFIRDALDGFVEQKTDFPVEVIIADDASTDATPQIIEEYADRYPHLFRPILRPQNVGIHANLSGALSAARGRYLALCEGDDFWTDPLKLSKQVAYMDAHPDVGVCFHPVRVKWEDGRPDDDSVFPPPEWQDEIDVDVLFARNFIQTNSVLYRRRPNYALPPNIMPMDYYLHVLHTEHGGIAMLPDVMATYRRHESGVWYGATVDRPRFWLRHGRGHAALFEAMLDLCAGNRTREQGIRKWSDELIRNLGSVPGPEGRELLRSVVAEHPRLLQGSAGQRWLVKLALVEQRARTTEAWIKTKAQRGQGR